VDLSLSPADSIHLDLNYSRSWFQTPNAYDNLNVQNVVGGGSSANPIFGMWATRTSTRRLDLQYFADVHTHYRFGYGVQPGRFVRRDDYNYYPSGNPLADLGPTNLQTSSITQNRTLMNTAAHSDFSYVKGIHNLKVGAQYGQTFLRERDGLGVVDATYNSPCVSLVTETRSRATRASRSVREAWRGRIRIIWLCLLRMT